MKFADRILGGIMGFLGVFCFVEAYRIWNGWDGTGVMPFLAGWISIILSVMFLVFPSRDTTPFQWPERKEISKIAIIGASFAFYIGLMNWVGYFIITWLFLAGITKYTSSDRISVILLWTGAVAGATYLIFKRFLGMYLPPGLIGI